MKALFVFALIALTATQVASLPALERRDPPPSDSTSSDSTSSNSTSSNSTSTPPSNITAYLEFWNPTTHSLSKWVAFDDRVDPHGQPNETAVVWDNKTTAAVFIVSISPSSHRCILVEIVSGYCLTVVAHEIESSTSHDHDHPKYIGEPLSLQPCDPQSAWQSGFHWFENGVIEFDGPDGVYYGFDSARHILDQITLDVLVSDPSGDNRFYLHNLETNSTNSSNSTDSYSTSSYPGYSVYATSSQSDPPYSTSSYYYSTPSNDYAPAYQTPSISTSTYYASSSSYSPYSPYSPYSTV